MNHSRNNSLRSFRIAHAALSFAFLSAGAVFGKDFINDEESAGPISVPPISIGDFTVTPDGGGTYDATCLDENGNPVETSIDSVDMFLGSSESAEWWVNDNSENPWTDLLFSGKQFAYHLQDDVSAGGTFWAAWSLEYQFFEYTSSFRHTDSQIPNGSIISFGLSDGGTPFPVADAVWNIESVQGMNRVATQPPSVADFSGTASFTWKSYEVDNGTSTDDLRWNLNRPTAPMTDYVVFVQLPGGEDINASGRTFDHPNAILPLSDSDMRGEGSTDEIVFNWTIDAKEDELGCVNPQFGNNIRPCAIAFTDSSGGVSPLYFTGDSLYLEAQDNAANVDSDNPDTLTVTLTNTNTGETEMVTLTETGDDTSLFTIPGGFPTTDTGNAGDDDGTLNVQEGDTITVVSLTGGVGESCEDSYTFPVEADLTKAVDKTTADAGDPLLYTIIPRYPGFALLKDVTVTDAVPADTTISGSPGQGGSHDGGVPGVVSWDLGSVLTASDGFVQGVAGGSFNYVDPFSGGSNVDIKTDTNGKIEMSGKNGSTGTSTWGTFWYAEVVTGGNKTKAKIHNDFELKADEGDDGDFACLSRVVPLAGATSATVTIVTSENVKVSDGSVVFQARYSSSASWMTLDTFSNGDDGSDFGSQVLDAAALGGALTDTAEIRFLVTTNTGNENKLKLDTVSVVSNLIEGEPELTTSLKAYPTLVADGDILTVELELGSDTDVNNVGPLDFAALIGNANGATLTLQSGPVPTSVDIVAGTSQIYIYTYLVDTDSATAPGYFRFVGRGTGDGNTIWAFGSSNSVLVSPPLTYNVIIDGDFTGTIPNTAVISDTSGFIPPTDSNEVKTVVVEEAPSPKANSFAGFIFANDELFNLDDNSIPGVPEIDPLTGLATASVDTDMDDFGSPGSPNPGLTGNVDGDVFNNLLEFALCFDPGSGTKVFPDGTPNPGFHLELNGSSLDAKFNQPTGVAGLVYEVEFSSDGQSWSALTGITPTTTSGPILGSTTVCYEGLDTSTSGLVRLKVSAGSGDAATTSVTGPVGWQMATIKDFCQTYADPLLEPCLVTGTIDSAESGTRVLDLTQASGTQALSVVLTAGKNYYLEVMSGDNIGHIFDIESFTAASVTLADDDDLCALSAPYSTRLTVPVNLAGDLFVIREHKTLEGLFPIDQVDTGIVEGFAAGINADNAGVLLRYDRNGGLESYIATSDAVTGEAWLASGVGPDNILPPGEGIFVHNLLGQNSFDILQYGEVRTNQLVVPLKEGYNFVAPAHPIVSQSINGGDSASRLMNDDSAGGKFVFDGHGARSLADQVQLWDDDTAPDAASVHICYNMIFYLRDPSGGNPSIDQWTVGGTPIPTNEEVKPLFEPNRSVMYCIEKDDLLEYYIPSPISNSVN